MKQKLVLVAALAAACGAAATTIRPEPRVSREYTAELSALHDRFRLAAISTRVFKPGDYWMLLSPLAAGPVRKEEVGRSAEGRPLYLLSYGNGPKHVLLWSQMHGDESTASMSLADLVQYLSAGDERTRRWADRLSIFMLPLLNPDGAERFHRENALGIDINRDARVLATPEARTLKTVRDRVQPHFGFNLHDQNVRTRVGNTDRLAAIALLAPPLDRAGSINDVRRRAIQVASVIRNALEPLVGGHIAKYDETFNPRAFGDLMQQWGTSTVLIESGGWRGDPEKQYLRKANFVALVAALDAIAGDELSNVDVASYESLPPNGRAARDLVVRGGTVVIPGFQPYRADLAIDIDERADSLTARIVEVGDLAEAHARDTLDATGLFIHPRPEVLTGQPGQRAYLRIGAAANFVITATPSEGSEPLFDVRAGRVTR